MDKLQAVSMKKVFFWKKQTNLRCFFLHLQQSSRMIYKIGQTESIGVM